MSVNHVLTFIMFQGKWDVPLPKVKAMSEADVFKVVKSGKSKSKCCDESLKRCSLLQLLKVPQQS